MFNYWYALSNYAGIHYPVYLSGTSEQSCQTGTPDSVWRKKLTCQVAFGDLTTFENWIRSTEQESKPDVFLEVSSGIPEKVSVINFAIKKKNKAKFQCNIFYLALLMLKYFKNKIQFAFKISAFYFPTMFLGR